MRGSLLASAPGKLFLSGEYAVLSGAPAVVTAVDRRAMAYAAKTAPPPSPVLAAVRREVARHFGVAGPGQLPLVRVDTSELSLGRRKLGLGSSAATAVAATAALLALGGAGELGAGELLALAGAAHRSAQRGRGSGADVAAAVYGGTLEFSAEREPRPLELRGIEPVFAWTGVEASTAELLAAVERLAGRDPAAHRDLVARLEREARDLAGAYRAGDAAGVIASSARYRELMEELGRAAGVAIVTAAHRRAAEIAEGLGGTAKPSGAGGGDCAVALFAEKKAAQSFRRECRAAGLEPLDLRPSAAGATIG
ncbi:MAG: hypothetical protein R6V85_14300 [Polyangia bacterium]